MAGQVPAGPEPPARSAGPRGLWRTLWRTADAADAEAWRRMRDGGPFRFARWAAVVMFFAVYWYVHGTPSAASGWLPVLIVFVLALWPDLKRLSVGGFSVEAREAAQRAERASDKAEQEREAAAHEARQFAAYFTVGQEAGKAAAEAAQATAAAKSAAPDAMKEFLKQDGS
jgi:hypothetical protein